MTRPKWIFLSWLGWVPGEPHVPGEIIDATDSVVSTLPGGTQMRMDGATSQSSHPTWDWTARVLGFGYNGTPTVRWGPLGERKCSLQTKQKGVCLELWVQALQVWRTFSKRTKRNRRRGPKILVAVDIKSLLKKHCFLGQAHCLQHECWTQVWSGCSRCKGGVHPLP